MTKNPYLSQLKILYVEDDDDTREDLKQYLKKKAGKVVTAADGKEGWKKYNEENPDIVIADIILPEMNGMEMLQKIRSAGGKCPFIITSSVDKTDTIIEAVDIGIVKYAVKPIILHQLMETLNKLAEDLKSGSPIFDDVEKKLELESSIKQAMTAFLKKSIGKGPRDLTVFISDEKIEVSAFGMITPLEKRLMADKHNVSMVEHIHKKYYQVVKAELEFMVKEIIGMNVELTDTDFSATRAIDRLTFVVSAA